MSIVTQVPSTGRIVHYRLSASDCERLHGRVGNASRVGDVVPLIVVRVWLDEFSPERSVGFPNPDGEGVVWTFPKSTYGINGQAILDGEGTLWVTSAPETDSPGGWSWPPLLAQKTASDPAQAVHDHLSHQPKAVVLDEAHRG